MRDLDETADPLVKHVRLVHLEGASVGVSCTHGELDHQVVVFLSEDRLEELVHLGEGHGAERNQPLDCDHRLELALPVLLPALVYLLS